MNYRKKYIFLFFKVFQRAIFNLPQVSKVDEFPEHIFSCGCEWFPFENKQDFLFSFIQLVVSSQSLFQMEHSWILKYPCFCLV